MAGLNLSRILRTVRHLLAAAMTERFGFGTSKLELKFECLPGMKDMSILLHILRTVRRLPAAAMTTLFASGTLILKKRYERLSVIMDTSGR